MDMPRKLEHLSDPLQSRDIKPSQSVHLIKKAVFQFHNQQHRSYFILQTSMRCSTTWVFKWQNILEGTQLEEDTTNSVMKHFAKECKKEQSWIQANSFHKINASGIDFVKYHHLYCIDNMM